MSYILQRFQVGLSYVHLPRLDPETPVGTGESQRVGLKTPGGEYYDITGDAQAQLDLPYDLMWHGVAVEDTLAELETTLQGLRALRGKRGLLYREMADGEVQFCTARVVSVPPVARPGKLVSTQPVDVTFEVQSGWKANHHGAGWLIGDPDVIIGDGHVLGEGGDVFDLVGSETICRVTNGGDGRVTDAVLTVTAGDKALTSVKVSLGDCDIEFIGTVNVSAQLVIDCGAASVHNNGVEAWNNLHLTAYHASDYWLVLEPGANDVVVTITQAGIGAVPATIEFDFNDRWE